MSVGVDRDLDVDLEAWLVGAVEKPCELHPPRAAMMRGHMIPCGKPAAWLMILTRGECPCETSRFPRTRYVCDDCHRQTAAGRSIVDRDCGRAVDVAWAERIR